VTARTAARAMVLRGPGQVALESVFVDLPEPDEVRVRVICVGVCHSDLHYVDGIHQVEFPEILGHEAAGVVESVGSNVRDIHVGDRVVTSLTMFCGSCSYCVSGRISLCAHRSRLRSRPRPAVTDDIDCAVGTMGGVGGFADLVVLHRNGVVVVDADLPAHLAALFGCAVLTGVGAVTRAARVPVGAAVAIIGCGGIGIAAIQGSRLAGASAIVAVDLSPERLAAAESFGATACVVASDPITTLNAIRSVLPGGADYAFEAVGRQDTAELAMAALAPGGTCTVLGMVPDHTPIRVPASELYFHEKRLQGAFIGSSRFTIDVPQLVDLHRQGRLDLESMVTHRIALADLNRGFDLLRDAVGLRVVVDVQDGGCW